MWLLLPAASAVATTQRPPDLNFEYTNTTDPLGESVPSHVVEAPSGVSSGRQPWQSFAPGGFRQLNAEQQSRRLAVRGWQDGPWNDVDPWVTVTWWVGLAIAGFSFCNCGSDLLVVCSGVAAFWIPNTNPWNSTYPPGTLLWVLWWYVLAGLQTCDGFSWTPKMKGNPTQPLKARRDDKRFVWRARRIGRRRMRQARLKFRRKAAKLRCFRWRQAGYRLKQKKPVFNDRLQVGAGHAPDSRYLQWLTDVSTDLEGGSAGSKRTLRKRRTSTGGEQQQPHMLRKLIQGLKLCLNGSIDPSAFWQQVESLAPEDAAPRRPKPKKRRKDTPKSLQFEHPDPKNSSIIRKEWSTSRGTFPYWQCTTTGWWWWQQARDASPTQACSGRDPKPPAPPQPQLSQRLQTSVTALRESEWTLRPVVVPLARALQVLKAGDTLTFNMVEVRSGQEWYDLCTAWSAFGTPKSVTVLLTGPAIEVEKAVCSLKPSSAESLDPGSNRSLSSGLAQKRPSALG